MYDPVSSKNAKPRWFILLNIVSVCAGVIFWPLVDTCYVKNFASSALNKVTASTWFMNIWEWPSVDWINGALLFFKHSYIHKINEELTISVLISTKAVSLCCPTSISNFTLLCASALFSHKIMKNDLRKWETRVLFTAYY